MFSSDPDGGGLPPLPPKWSNDDAAAAASARALDKALDELAGVPAGFRWELTGVHDFDQDDPQGRCRRTACRVSLLDAGPECPGDEVGLVGYLDEVDAAVASITDDEVEARLRAVREDLGRSLAGQLDMDAGLAAITGTACAQPHPPGTHDQCPPGAPCHGGGPR